MQISCLPHYKSYFMNKITSILILFLLALNLQAQELPEGWPADGGGGIMNLTIKGQTVNVPYWYNKPINQTNDKVTRAIIAIHGINRWSKSILDRILVSVERENLEDETIVLCPVFLQEEEYNHYGLDNSYPWWTSRWKHGDLSQDRTVTRTSSYEVIDEMLATVQKNNPNLDLVVVTGFSAGGQFTNRYAAAGRGPNSLPDNIEQRFIVHAPSSYVYLSDKRLVNGIFKPVNTSCDDYNEYHYGLDGGLNNYVSTTTVPQVIENYKKRTVIHMVGQEDTEEAYLDVSCGANLQGANRVDRAITYYKYLLSEFEDNPEYTENKYLLVVDGYAHSSKVYKTLQVSKYMFNDLSELPNSNVELITFINDIPIAQEGDWLVYPNPVYDNWIRIESNESRQTQCNLEIIDLSGRVVKMQNDYCLEESVFVGDLQSGIYVLRLKGDKYTKVYKLSILN